MIFFSDFGEGSSYSGFFYTCYSVLLAFNFVLENTTSPSQVVLVWLLVVLEINSVKLNYYSVGNTSLSFICAMT